MFVSRTLRIPCWLREIKSSLSGCFHTRLISKLGAFPSKDPFVWAYANTRTWDKTNGSRSPRKGGYGGPERFVYDVKANKPAAGLMTAERLQKLDHYQIHLLIV